MFSIRQKRELSEKIQQLLRNTKHPELPQDEIEFNLEVKGAESWSYAMILNNNRIPNPDVNPWNEMQDKEKK